MPSSTSNGPTSRAPIGGRISDRKVDAGNLVSGGSGRPTLLTTIVTLDPIHFVFEGSEADYIRYSRLNAAGQRPSSRDVQNPVQVRLADETEWTHTGHMNFVDNEVNARSGTIRGRAVFDNKDYLLHSRHLRPPAPVRRRGGRAADARRRDRVRSGA